MTNKLHLSNKFALLLWFFLCIFSYNLGKMSFQSFKGRQLISMEATEQFYTSEDVIELALEKFKKCASVTSPVPLVDFSCGTNAFLKACKSHKLVSSRTRNLIGLNRA